MSKLDTSTQKRSINVEEFLKTNKLNQPKIIKKFKSLQIEIKELFQFHFMHSPIWGIF